MADSENEKDDDSIASCTEAIRFLSTPHWGSYYAQLVALYRKMKLGSFFLDSSLANVLHQTCRASPMSPGRLQERPHRVPRQEEAAGVYFLRRSKRRIPR